MMTDAPTTHASLLARLGDARDADCVGAVRRAATRRRSIGFARRNGLQDADAADLTQDVLRNVSGAFRRGGFDAKLGSFRSWLFTVVRNRLRDLATSPKRHDRGAGDTATLDRLGEIPDAVAEPGELWDQECERQMFTWAAEQVRARFARRRGKRFGEQRSTANAAPTWRRNSGSLSPRFIWRKAASWRRLRNK